MTRIKTNFVTRAFVSSSCSGVHVEYNRFLPLPFNFCELTDVVVRSRSCRKIDCSSFAVVFKPDELRFACGRFRVGVVERSCALVGRAGRRLPTISFGFGG